MDISKAKKTKLLAYKMIQSFPRSKGNEPFLTLQNGRKLFFSIFIKKYGLDGDSTKYIDQDIVRRVRLVEFFDYFVKTYSLESLGVNHLCQPIYKIESAFHKMVILDVASAPDKSQFELLSFFPL